MKKKMVSILLFLILACLTGCTGKEAKEQEPQVQLPKDILNAEDSFHFEMELEAVVPRKGGYRYVQGGCVTEEYAYFATLHEDTITTYYGTETCIVKFDTETWEEVARSESLMLGHANDITYIPETNELYVAHCTSPKLFVLDADTLTLKDTVRVNLNANCDAITYTPEREQLVALVGNTGHLYMDLEGKVSGSANAKSTSMITQGICSDDMYVYHVLCNYNSETVEWENVIFVIDYEGNLISEIPLAVNDYELENVSLVGDTFYMGYNASTVGLVYSAKLVKDEPVTAGE